MKKGFLIDMDGVIYSGDTMIPGADTFIASLQKEKIPFLFRLYKEKMKEVELQE